MKIIIDEEVDNSNELTTLLEYVQRLVDEGYTSGYYPHWHLEEE